MAPRNPVNPFSDKAFARRLALLGVAAASALPLSAWAAAIPKADNAEPLSSGLSWVGGEVPGATDVALWDARFLQASPLTLGVSLAWAGIRIEDVSQPVSLASGSLLTVGAGGIDLSAAGQSLEAQGALHLAASQTWGIASDRSFTLGGALSRANGVTLDVALAEGANVVLAGGATGGLLLASSTPYATLNRRDFAAVDANGRIAPGAEVLTYTPNPSTGLPTMSGTINGVLDVVNSGTYGVRLGNNLTVTNGVRFAVPHDTADRWQIDAPSGRGFTVGAVLVAPELGTDRVIMTGTGFLRGSNNQAAGGLVIHQGNPAADFEVAVAIINYASSFTPLTKTGPGTLQLSANCYYTGPTYVQDGTLLVGADNSAATGALSVHAPAVLGGTGIVGGPATILPGAVLAPKGLTFNGPLALQGDLLLQIDDLTPGAVAHDSLTVAPTGSLSCGGGLVLNINQVLAAGDYTVQLLEFPGTPAGSFATVELGGAYQLSLVNTGGVWTGATGGVTFSYSEATGVLTINVPVTQTNGTLILISQHDPAAPSEPALPAASLPAVRRPAQSAAAQS